MTPMNSAARHDHVVAAELVASVLDVEVETGDLVSPTDVVCVLESMKMEIPVVADATGHITEIVVKPGDLVREGDPLVVVRPRD